MTNDLFDHLGAARRGSRDPYLAGLAQKLGGPIGTVLLNASAELEEVTGLTPMVGDVVVVRRLREVWVYTLLQEPSPGMFVCGVNGWRGGTQVSTAYMVQGAGMCAPNARLWRPVATITLKED